MAVTLLVACVAATRPRRGLDGPRDLDRRRRHGAACKGHACANRRRRRAPNATDVAGVAATPDGPGDRLRKCKPFRMKPQLHGFGNVLSDLAVAYSHATRCGLPGLALIESDEEPEADARLKSILGPDARRQGFAPDRFRRVCERLGCKDAKLVHAPPGFNPTTKGTPGVPLRPPECPEDCVRGKKQFDWRTALKPVDKGAWLINYTCAGPNLEGRRGGDRRPFEVAVHVRSLRFDFERPPASIERDRGLRFEAVQTNPKLRGKISRGRRVDPNRLFNDSAPVREFSRYKVSSWRRLAKRILADRPAAVYVASDNEPVRDELVARIVERDGTACWVPATPTHSTFHASAADDDYVLSDWWRLAKATKEIFMVPLDCLGKTSNTCQYTGEPSARGSKGLSTFSYSAFQFRGRRRQNKTYTILPEDTRRRLQDAPVARVRRSPIPRRRSGPSARGGRGRDHGRAPDGPDGGPDVSDGPLKACPPLVLKAPLHGFGNVIEQMMGGYERARNCGHAGLQLITADELAADIPAGQKRFGPPDRYRRICERLGCENATLVPPPKGFDPTRHGRQGGGKLTDVEDRVLHRDKCPRCAPAVGGPTFDFGRALAPTNEGRWLAKYTCVGPNPRRRTGEDRRPFDVAVHFRSLRNDFEPQIGMTWQPGFNRDRWKRQHDGPGDARPVSAGKRYNASEWAGLAKAVLAGADEVYIASDNKPVTDEFAARIVELNGTACFLDVAPKHSAYFATPSDDDAVLTDWWTLATVRDTIFYAPLQCSAGRGFELHRNRPHGNRASDCHSENLGEIRYGAQSSFSKSANVYRRSHRRRERGSLGWITL